MNRTEVTRHVKEYARKQGARLVGVANAERLGEAPKGHRPEDFLPAARSVVVLGLPLLRAYVRYPEFLKDSEKVPETVTRRVRDIHHMQVAAKETEETYYPRRAIAMHVYRRCGYEFLNMELQRLSLYVALWLEDAGYDSIYMPTAYGATFTWQMSYPRPNFMGPFSHRHAAVAAGLGRFGMNNLIFTPRYGSLQRFVSVITSADLQPDPLLAEEICLGEKCEVCRDSCPNDCFTDGVEEYEFGGARARMWRMDKDRCGSYEDPTRTPCTQECWFKCPLSAPARTQPLHNAP